MIPVDSFLIFFFHDESLWLCRRNSATSSHVICSQSRVFSWIMYNLCTKCTSTRQNKQVKNLSQNFKSEDSIYLNLWFPSLLFLSKFVRYYFWISFQLSSVIVLQIPLHDIIFFRNLTLPMKLNLSWYKYPNGSGKCHCRPPSSKLGIFRWLLRTN